MPVNPTCLPASKLAYAPLPCPPPRPTQQPMRLLLPAVLLSPHSFFPGCVVIMCRQVVQSCLELTLVDCRNVNVKLLKLTGGGSR